MVDVSIRQVRKSYGKTEVIHGVDVEIRTGEFAVIVGPSGCGKSTLLRMIAGLEAIGAGEIAIGGKVVNDVEPKDRGVAMVFQNYALYPHMTVFRNIGYALKIARRPKAEIRERVERVAQALGLSDLLERKPSQLSGGQRQRVAMGRAIVREPGVFLFDEPLSNLDAQLRGEMRVEIKRLHKELKATSVFVTHDQVEAMTMADRLVVMNGGFVEQIGTPREVYARPNSVFVAGFMGSPAMNFLRAMVAADGATVVFDDEHRQALTGAVGPAFRGRPVTVGIRPEDVRIGAGDGPAGVSARLRYSEDLGASQLLHVLIGDNSLIVHTKMDADVQPDQMLPLIFEPARLHLFDPETGRRLQAPDYDEGISHD
ncbi:MAG: sn-glycerol-3-phosphate ABC transporter ATP-binding protein UgpC [Burkholderiaceae bacterium]